MANVDVVTVGAVGPPGPTGPAGSGGGGVFCVAGLSGTASSMALHRAGAATYPAVSGDFPAQYFVFPLNYIAAQSGGFTTGRTPISTPTAFGDFSLSVPETGWYWVTMQCVYYDIEFSEAVAYGQINHWLYGGFGDPPSDLTQGPLASGGWGDLVISSRSFFNSTSDDQASFNETFPEQGVPWLGSSFHVQAQGALYLTPSIALRTEASFQAGTFSDGGIFPGSSPLIIPGTYAVTVRKFA